MTYERPWLHALDLDASQACCGAHGGACQPPPEPEPEPNPVPPVPEVPTVPEPGNPTIPDASAYVVGLLGCYAIGTC